MWHIKRRPQGKTMEKFIRLLQTHMEEPKPFGAFHLTAVAVVLILTIVLCVFFRNADATTYRNILISIWAVMFVMEGVRQLTLSCTFTPEGKAVWAYQWHAFPLQLCDSPLYILLPIALLKNGKLRTMLSSYAFTYVLLGGLATYIAPDSISTTVVYLNVQTLAHHGLQIASCIYIGVYNRKNIKLRRFLDAFIVFIIAVCIATIFNVVMHKIIPDQVINMFYISPYFLKTAPLIFNAAWSKLGGIGRLFFYIGGMTGIAFIIFMVFYLFALFFKRRQAKASAQTA